MSDVADSAPLPDALEEVGFLDFPPYDRALSLTVGIVSAYVSHNAIPASDLPGLIRSVRAALSEGEQAVGACEAPAAPAVPIGKSITPDHLVSLLDGKPYKSLKRHLTSHGLTPNEYRQKFGLPSDYPMVAANYAKARSDLAKAMGLGQLRRAADTTPEVAQAA